MLMMTLMQPVKKTGAVNCYFHPFILLSSMYITIFILICLIGLIIYVCRHSEDDDDGDDEEALLLELDRLRKEKQEQREREVSFALILNLMGLCYPCSSDLFSSNSTQLILCKFYINRT